LFFGTNWATEPSDGCKNTFFFNVQNLFWPILQNEAPILYRFHIIDQPFAFNDLPEFAGKWFKPETLATHNYHSLLKIDTNPIALPVNINSLPADNHGKPLVYWW